MTMNFKVIAGAGALVWMSAVGPVLAADIPAAAHQKGAGGSCAEPELVRLLYRCARRLRAGAAMGWMSCPDAFYTPLFSVAGVPRSACG